ncbi:MAG TPA: hypothetical protein V6D22_12920 [Candidatus Obscuribacterales bacterium]
MKSLVLVATTTLLAAVVIMPVSAEPCVQTERTHPQAVRLFHTKKIALKQEAGSQSAETVKPSRANLDYATDNFIIN